MAGICPGCVIGPACGSFFGAWLVSKGYTSGYYLETPKRTGTKILSFVLTSNYTVMTTLAIKTLFHVSFCGPAFTLKRAIVILLGATAVGILYTLPINYLLNRFVDPRPLPPPQPLQKKEDQPKEETSSGDPKPSPCCCSKPTE